MVKIITEYGFCFGVKHAIEMINIASKKYQHVYLTHPLIHNKVENEKIMSENHASFFNEHIECFSNSCLVLSAHGHTIEEENKYSKNLPIIDATCPLIINRYKMIPKYDETTSFIYLGKENHQETLGFLSHFKYFNLITKEDIENGLTSLNLKNKIVFVPQTTISNELYEYSLYFLKNKGDVIFTLPVCSSYKSRASTSINFLKKVDINVSYFVVVGDKSSSNANEIFNSIKKHFTNLDGQIALTIDDIDMNKIKNKDIYLTSATSVSSIMVEKLLKDLNYLENKEK